MRIADKWFEIQAIDDRITLLYEPHVCPLERCNIWHVRGRERDMVVDFGMGIGDLKQAMEALLQKPVLAVATHSHHDHIGSFAQFEHRCLHHLEQQALQEGVDFPVLCGDQWPPVLRAIIQAQGYEVPNRLIDALPHAGFDCTRFRVPTCRATHLLEEGDTLDLGDLAFEVLHLPGHSPGSIGLWNATTGILFSGDTVYDGPLLDETPDADIERYIASMKRLLQLPVETVHAGHDPSFGRERLQELCRQYIEKRGG